MGPIKNQNYCLLVSNANCHYRVGDYIMFNNEINIYKITKIENNVLIKFQPSYNLYEVIKLWIKRFLNGIN